MSANGKQNAIPTSADAPCNGKRPSTVEAPMAARVLDSSLKASRLPPAACRAKFATRCEFTWICAACCAAALSWLSWRKSRKKSTTATMTTATTFGAWVRQRRRALDLTQAELAGTIGYSTITVRRVESGERRPSRELIDSLAAGLRVPGDQLDAFRDLGRRLVGSAPPPTRGKGSTRRPMSRSRPG